MNERKFADVNKLMSSLLYAAPEIIGDREWIEYQIGKAIVEDVKQVKHGHWIIDFKDGWNVSCHCSECDHRDEHASCVDVPYCWFCGAKMDNKYKWLEDKN